MMRLRNYEMSHYGIMEFGVEQFHNPTIPRFHNQWMTIGVVVVVPSRATVAVQWKRSGKPSGSL